MEGISLPFRADGYANRLTGMTIHVIIRVF